MADAPPVRETPPDTGSGLNTKLGPLPYWGWIAISAAAGIVGILWWRNRKGGQDAQAQTQPSAGPQIESDGMATGQYESLLALLRDIQGQPSTPLPGDPGPTPPAGTTPPSDDGSPRTYPAFTLVVKAGQHVTDFTDAIRARNGFDVDWSSIEAANPTLAKDINWGPSGSKDLSLRTFKRNTTYTIPAVIR